MTIRNTRLLFFCANVVTPYLKNVFNLQHFKKGSSYKDSN